MGDQARNMEDIIRQLAEQTGRSAEDIKACLSDEADRDWSAIRVYLSQSAPSRGSGPTEAPADDDVMASKR